ncbi:muscle M-line assembly protein unc-89-like protein [Leptotrombidium deliense]|uniref:Muscle M-line assembly protein unc-89-like protein n=1 Tax=Leptotrombidium deliense TaxID=299467 RepID=A0A443SBW2_9ACAR|nr:muscle M-line assembly protein unc-89-like protein [Leptotrombidium deliense]
MLNFKGGDDAVFECEIDAETFPNIEWLKDNEKLETSERITKTSIGSRHKLTIKSVTDEDAAVYTVVASNSNESVSSSATLSVKPDPSKGDSRPATPGGTLLPHAPVFKVKLKDTELLEGTTVRFEIIVRAFPHATLQFFKNGKVLEEDNRVKIIQESKEAYELVIDQVKPTDAGVYKCVARNKEGEDETTGKITITKHKNIFKGIERQETQETSLSADAVSPRPDSKSPVFHWFRDGKEIEASERFQCQFDNSEDTITLVFQHVTPGDAGLYTCVASTTSGKISCSAELTVQGEVHRLAKDPEAPSIKKQISDIEVNEGSSAMLEVKITGYPRPIISWFKETEEIEIDERHKFLTEDEESYTLVVKNVKSSDSGKYTVKAKNDLGEVESTGKLTVTCSPKFKKQLSNTHVNVDGQLRLEMSVESNPEALAKWFKDGQPLQENPRIHFLHPESDVYALIIDKVKLEDAGNYAVILENPIGQQSGHAVVTVDAPLKFEPELKDVNAEEDETVEFKVKITGARKPDSKSEVTDLTVKWFVDDVLITELDNRFSIIEDESNSIYKLIVKKANEGTVGQYKCKARTSTQEAETSATITLLKKPEFAEGLEDLEVKEDESIAMTVVILGSPRPSLTWTKDGEELVTSANIKITQESEQVYTLELLKISVEMSGVYECRAKNKAGEASTKGRIETASAPRFTKDLRDISVSIDESINLEVHVVGSPKPTVEWYKDGQKITKSDTENEDTKYKLKFKSVKKDDEGTYYCIARNKVGETKSASVSMTVKIGGQEKEQSPKFVGHLKDVEANLNDSVTLEVKVDGSPKPDLTWLHDGKEIQSGKECELSADDDGDGVYKLRIPKVSKDSAGEYTAKAQNVAGTQESSCSLTVKLAPEVMQAEEAEAELPIFISELKDVEVKLEESVILEVRIEGIPTPELKWFHNGKEASNSGDFELSSDPAKGVFKLHIPKVSKDSAGSYTAKATNVAGTKESSCSLTVKLEPKSSDNEAQIPKFVSELKDIEAVLNDKVVLQVEIEGPKPELTWYFNGKEIGDGDGYLISSDDNKGIYKLEIPKVTSDELGKYTVAASNSGGKAESSCSLKSKEQVKPPKFVNGLNDVDVPLNDRVLLEVKVEGSPKPEIQWFHNGVKVSTGNDYIVSGNENQGIYRLEIPKVTSDLLGKYTVSASNSGGKVESSGSLKQKEQMKPPKFVRGLSDVDVPLNDSIVLEVKVEATPKPEVQWFHNGAKISTGNDYVVSGKENQGIYKLEIPKVTSDLLGRYTVSAENSAGKVESTGSLNARRSSLDDGRERSPKFVSGLEDVAVNLNDSATFEVQIDGTPKADVKWFHNGKEIVPDDDHVLSSDDRKGVYRLHIPNVTPDLLGKYAVEATNSGGKAESSGYLNEKTKPKIEGLALPPRFVKHLTDLIVSPNDNVTLEVQIEGIPKPDVKWFHNGKEISAGDEYILSSDANKATYRLQIPKVTSGLLGKYSVIAENIGGKVESSGSVSHVEPPNAGGRG